MKTSASKLYDIQGKLIKVGCLIAYPRTATIMRKGRVTKLCDKRVAVGGRYVIPEICVVLEEPVWPNS